MSDAVILALIASIAPTIAGIAAVIVGIRNTGKLTQIHTLTNSNLSKITTSLEVAQTKIEGLEKLVVTMADAKVAAEKVQRKSKK